MRLSAVLMVNVITICSLVVPRTFPQSVGRLEDDCLRCICAASSECDPQVRCHTVGPIEYYCGPYQISQRYWKEAGSPGADPNNPLDFEECANNIGCAIEAVEGYLDRNARDCDFDDKITCDDFALIHKSGPKRCHEPWIRRTKFWSEYNSCAQANL